MDAVTARMIPVGARVVRVYWALPTAYSAGDEFASEVAAVEAGIERKREAVAAHVARTTTPLPESFSVDLRWAMSWDPTTKDRTSGTDMVVSRTTYASLDEAVAHVDRIRRFRFEGSAGEKRGDVAG